MRKPIFYKDIVLLLLAVLLLGGCLDSDGLFNKDKTDASASIGLPFKGAVSAIAVSNHKVQLKWNLVSDANDVKYVVYPAGDASPKRLATTINRKYTMVTGLSPSTYYEFIVRSENSAGEEDSNKAVVGSKTFAFEVPDFDGVSSGGPLDGVDGLYSARLSWEIAGGNVTGYRIYRSLREEGQDFSAPLAVEGSVLANTSIGPYLAGKTKTSATIHGLIPGTTYYFVVRAFYLDGSDIYTEKNTIEVAVTTEALSNALPAPILTSVSPMAGSPDGATPVTILGSNFLPGSTVSFDGLPCDVPVVLLSTMMTCLTPAHASGTVTVTITSPTGKRGSLVGAYTYSALPPPTLLSISPIAGLPVGGKSVTLSGTNFAAGAQVSIGGAPCAVVVASLSSSSVNCVTTFNSPGTFDVVLTNPDRQQAVLRNAFTYRPAPTVASISPSLGPLSGGTAVTILGTYFTSASQVSIGGVDCSSVNFTSPQSISCFTGPNTAKLAEVTVTNADGQSGTQPAIFNYTATPPPLISSLSQTAGPLGGGTLLVIRGTGFNPLISITLDGLACTSLLWTSSTKITCRTPAHTADSVDVVALNPDTQTGTLARGYTYTTVAAPRIALISPTAGPPVGNTPVTLTGTGFTSGATVTIGGGSCGSLTFVSSTEITCRTGAHGEGPADVVLTNPDTQYGTLVNGFNYTSAPGPVVSAVSPQAGPKAGGTRINISGSFFNAGATITVGGVPCTTPNVLSATSITCTTGVSDQGTFDIIVTNADGQAGTKSAAYTYLGPLGVTSVLPNGGAIDGGTRIAVYGSGFVAGATVSLGGQTCSSVVVVNSLQLNCTTSPHAPGMVSVQVTSPDLQTASLANVYTYRQAPRPVSLVPTSGGDTGGGVVITIKGTGFLDGAIVKVDGVNCFNSAFISANRLTCSTPPHASGTVNVEVLNPDNQSGIIPRSFTYGPLNWTRLDTLAGPGNAFGYQDGVGSDAKFYHPNQLVTNGNSLYVSDQYNHVLRRINLITKAVTTIAGAPGTSGCIDSDAAGLGAKFTYPAGLTLDPTGLFLYVADQYCHAIRRVEIATGRVVTVAGYLGSAGAADGTLSGRLFYPFGIATDNVYLYVSDEYNHSIRRVDVADFGRITTLAGALGQAGAVDGTGSDARFKYPLGLSTDGVNLYVADYSNHAIRKVEIASGVVTTLAGTLSTPPTYGQVNTATGPGSDAKFYYPYSTATDGSVVYVADHSNGVIRRIQIATGQVETVIPYGTRRDGALNYAVMGHSTGVALDGSTLYFSEFYNHGIRKIDFSTNMVSTIAGAAAVTGYVNATGTDARFNSTYGVASDGTYVYSTDWGSHAIRKTSLATGEVTTFVGSTTGAAATVDDIGTNARLHYPRGLATDGAYLYFTEYYTCLIRKVSLATAQVSTVAGSGCNSTSVDGPSQLARFWNPDRIATDGTSLFVTENHVVRKVDIATGEVTTLAGLAGTAGVTDGVGSGALLSSPNGITTDGTSVFVGEWGSCRIRKIDPVTRAVITLAGSACAGDADGLGTAAAFYYPHDITNDGTFLYVAEYHGLSVRKVRIDNGQVTTLFRSSAVREVDGPFSSAFMVYPQAIGYFNSEFYIGNDHNLRRLH